MLNVTCDALLSGQSVTAAGICLRSAYGHGSRRGARGPAKGYVEALETRLKVTEGVLWRLLSSSNEQDLLRAFDDHIIAKTPKSLTICTLATTDEKRSAISHWEQFPLRSAAEVQTWMQNLEPMPTPEPSLALTSITGENDAPQDSWVATEEPRPDYPEREMTEQYDHQREFHATAPSSEANSTVSVARDELPFTQNRLQALDYELSLSAQGSHPSRSAVAGKFGLSSEFQDTFLW
ncbi:hypothetical protein LTR84_008586 [Exophiala bonariae]|uniref:Uncharacterized protein n=1 Tax=Exophiala bonariae TaxID=1690606 RepID=A0AAV9MWQ6_9EURO|nr:hypothetical protein LTR84_008586 [Exophiala bonariae]